MDKKVTLIESFKTFQGEGPDAGRPMLILRFKECNKRCQWCDTAVKMRISMEFEMSLENIQKQINENNCGILVTGGEPTFKKNFDQTLMLLNELKYPIANVETNGYNLFDLLMKVSILDKNIKFMYSPKIFSKVDLENEKKKIATFQDNVNVFLKVVYDKNYQELIDEFLAYVITLDNIVKDHRLYLMPEGVTRVDLLRNASIVFDACEKYKASFSSREHIIYSFV
jgi:7-carboxy-7-deazaguanine synthase